MEVQYNTKGTIYLTEEKYQEYKTAGTLVAGQEYCIITDKVYATTDDLINKADLVNGLVPVSQIPSSFKEVVEFEKIITGNDSSTKTQVVALPIGSIAFNNSDTTTSPTYGKKFAKNNTGNVLDVSVVEPEVGKIYIDKETNKMYRWSNGLQLLSSRLGYRAFYTITTTLTNVTASGSNPTSMLEGETKTLTFTANSGYALPSSVSVSGATSNWNSTTGVLTLTNVVDEVTISVVGRKVYTITATANNVVADASNPTSMFVEDTKVLKFTADGTNYEVPYDAPTVTGATSVYNRISNTECTITLTNPTANISFTVEGWLVVPMPTKGQLVYMNIDTSSNSVWRGNNNIYRILSIDGRYAKAMAMFDVDRDYYSNSYSTYTYANSNVDAELTSWYNALPTTSKNAIIVQDMVQYKYNRNASVKTTNHQSYADYSTKATYTTPGTRYACPPTIEDIETYFNGTFTSNDLSQFFFNTTSSSGYYYIWTSDYCNSSSGIWVYVESNKVIENTNTRQLGYIRPVIIVDLTKMSWIDAGPYTITNNLTNCTRESGITQLYAGTTGTITYKESVGYQLPTTVSVTNATSSWSKANRTLTLSNPTGQVSVTIVGETRTDPYPITRVYSPGLTQDASNPTEIPARGSSVLKFTANSGYMLPFTEKISAFQCTKSWNRATGELTLSNPTDSVWVSIEGQLISEEIWEANSVMTNLYTGTYETDFTSNNTHYNSIRVDSTNNKVYFDNTLVYDNGIWTNETYRTMNFTYVVSSGTYSLYSDFLDYNAVLKGPFSIEFSCQPSPSTTTTESYYVYDGEDSTGTLLGTISDTSTTTLRCTTGKVYCVPVNAGATFEYSASTIDGMTNVDWSSSSPSYVKASVDSTYTTHRMWLRFNAPKYNVTIYNDSSDYMSREINIYGSSMSFIGMVSPGSSQTFEIPSGEIQIYNSMSSEYPYSSSSTTGSITETRHTESEAYFNVAGEGTIHIAFEKPTYQVTLRSNDRSVTFYDSYEPGMGTYLCTLSDGQSETVSVTSGYVSGSWDSSYRYRYSDTSGGVGYPMTTSTGFSSTVTGPGSLAITVGVE